MRGVFGKAASAVSLLAIALSVSTAAYAADAEADLQAVLKAAFAQKTDINTLATSDKIQKTCEIDQPSATFNQEENPDGSRTSIDQKASSIQGEGCPIFAREELTAKTSWVKFDSEKLTGTVNLSSTSVREFKIIGETNPARANHFVNESKFRTVTTGQLIYNAGQYTGDVKSTGMGFLFLSNGEQVCIEQMNVKIHISHPIEGDDEYSQVTTFHLRYHDTDHVIEIRHDLFGGASNTEMTLNGHLVTSENFIELTELKP